MCSPRHDSESIEAATDDAGRVLYTRVILVKKCGATMGYRHVEGERGRRIGPSNTGRENAGVACG